MKERYQQLDSLRGIAALTVVFAHLLDIGVYEQTPWWPLLCWLPIRILYAGHQAVILFFVLSGFVLSIPYHEGRQLPYRLFAMRRFVRIWVPYAAIIVLTFLWRKWSNENSVPAVPLSHGWQTPLSTHLLISHLRLIFGMDLNALVPAAWTLIYEMRISLLFPLIVWIYTRLSWQLSVLVAILSSLGANLAYTSLTRQGWGDTFTLLLTIHYASMFVIGSLLARYRSELVTWEQGLSRNKTCWFYLATFVFYVYPFNNPWSTQQRMLGDLVITAGSSGLIVLALSSGRTFFEHRWPVFLGRISYSLYLVHGTIMGAVANSLFLKVPNAVLYIVILATQLSGAFVFWWLVERPALALSRTIVSGRNKRVVSDGAS